MYRTIALLVAAAVPACSIAPDARIAASASAEACNGEIVTREVSPEERANLNASMAILEKVGEEFPPSPLPLDAPTWKVASISDGGVIYLTNGGSIVMDGVSCSSEGLANIRRWLIGQDTKVTFVHHSPTELAKAEVWAVTTYGDLEFKAYSAVAESALTSGWCWAKKSTTNRQNKRYEALMKQFAMLREAQEELRANQDRKSVV